MPRILLIAAGVILLIAVALIASPPLRHGARLALGLEPRPPITPLVVGALPVAPPSTVAAAPPAPLPAAAATPAPLPDVIGAAPIPSPTPAAAPTPAPPSPSPQPPAPVLINGRSYEAYIPAAVKGSQAYQYSCEFDAAWVILQTFGVNVDVDAIIARAPFDRSVEPSFAETPDGFVITGGDIRQGFSGDYHSSFLARSSGSALVPLFAEFGLRAEPVRDRAGVEAALRAGALIWMKTTVDFKPWRPATWVTPDGSRIQTVLGNDHAVVVIGFNQEVVVIRDVLGPTSTNRQRPLEYEVAWETFLWAWGAQGFDGLSVAPAPGMGW